MGTKIHKAKAPKSVKIGIITVSTTRTLEDDESGRWISKLAKKEGHEVVFYQIVPDDTETITQTVVHGIDVHDPQVILLTGGTGISSKDVTIEAVRPLFEKELTAFAPLFSQLSFEDIDSAALLSRATAGVVEAVRERTSKLVIAKLSPNVTDITEIARSAESAGADALSLINTITGMAIDVDTRRSKLANITGGLSGPAIKPVAVRMVWQVAQAVKLPVIGIGGIMNARDALEFFIAGASAIEIGTANFVNPRATMDILEGIKIYLQQNNIDKLSSIIGTLEI